MLLTALLSLEQLLYNENNPNRVLLYKREAIGSDLISFKPLRSI
jgi:hypothetical protein